MLRAIGAAKTQIWIEMYWFASDTIGQRFFADLVQAARRGVDVRLLYDSFGSFATDTSFFAALVAAGAHVLEYNPVSPLQRRFGIQSLAKRNHGKLLIVDDTAFVGGLNIADAWLPSEQGGENWRDDVVCVKGPVVAQLERSFARSWCEAGGGPMEVSQGEHPKVGNAKASVLGQSQFGHRRYALQAYRVRLRKAQEQVLIANAYFVPNRKIIRGLVGAAKRGVDVRVMLPQRSDVEIVRLAGQAAWSRLLRVGVRIYQWQPTILHTKTAVIDSEWVTIGSYNLDYLSMFTNVELNLSILDRDFARTVGDAYFEDLKQCQEVLWSQFRNRPMLTRVVERILYAFRSWL
jgi:cardiolipin synthase